jgi:parallel beta-helix repeat protein
MKKSHYISVFSIIIMTLLVYGNPLALDTPVITAIAKGPNQINLTWSAVTNPGWGYKVEIQSDNDSRYSSWTELPITRNGRNYLPYWVTENHYTDITDGSGTSMGSVAQFQMYGLKHGTTYNFRVRCYAKTDAGVEVYGSYSNTATATTTTPSTIRYVTPGGAGLKNGTSWENAWPKISSANNVSAGTLILVRSGNYTNDHFYPTNSGTQTNRIILQAEPVSGTTVTITSTDKPQTIVLRTNYVVVDGINIDDSTAEYKVYITGSRNAIVNMDIDVNQQASDCGPYITGIYNLVHYCYFHDSPKQDDTYVLVIYNGGYNVVQYSHGSRGGHDTTLVIGAAKYNQIKNNLYDGGYGMGIEIITTVAGYNLVEGNVIKNAGKNQTYYFKPGIEISSSYNTVRRNIIQDGGNTSSQSLLAGGIELSQMGGYVAASNNLIYNNVIVHNAGYGIYGSGTAQNNIIANNIFYDNGDPIIGNGPDQPSADISIMLYGNYSGTVYKNNLILYRNWSTGLEDPNHGLINKDWESTSRTLAYAHTYYSPYFQNNFGSITPDFIDYANRELHLKSTSGLIDAGIPVKDNTWGTIGFSGSAPDIGAFEYWGNNKRPTAPQNLRIILIQ